MAVPRVGGRRAAPLALAALLVGAALGCSTGDPDPAPADAGRIERTTARVDSALQPARARMRTIDSLGRSAE